MASNDCCNLVGNFFDETTFSFNDCIISVNNNINTDLNDYGCDTLLPGASMGSLNISAYVGTEVYKGCAGRANVQVLWMRKFICSLDKTAFIFLGGGRASATTHASDYVTILKPADDTTKVITASAQSGPGALFTNTEQLEGLGMSYSRGPFSFNTSDEGSCTVENMGIGVGPYYLQNFNLELVPGSIPIASYTYAYNPK